MLRIYSTVFTIEDHLILLRNCFGRNVLNGSSSGAYSKFRLWLTSQWCNSWTRMNWLDNSGFETRVGINWRRLFAVVSRAQTYLTWCCWSGSFVFRTDRVSSLGPESILQPIRAPLYANPEVVLMLLLKADLSAASSSHRTFTGESHTKMFFFILGTYIWISENEKALGLLLHIDGDILPFFFGNFNINGAITDSGRNYGLGKTAFFEKLARRKGIQDIFRKEKDATLDEAKVLLFFGPSRRAVFTHRYQWRSKVWLSECCRHLIFPACFICYVSWNSDDNRLTWDVRAIEFETRAFQVVS